jgi:hypothetical protein
MEMLTKILWRIFLLTILIFFCIQSVHADIELPPESYKKITKNGEFVFVMLSPGIENCEGYIQSGLYKNNGSKIPLWTVGWNAGDIEISSDGNHLIRKGFWASSYGDEAVSFFTNGKLLKSYTIDDLVHFPCLMPHTASHFMWCLYEGFSDSNLTHSICTLHGEYYVFDVKTGKIISSCWIYLWIFILSLIILFGTRLLISKYVYLFFIGCIGLIVFYFVGFFQALVVIIGLWVAGIFIAKFFDPSFPWSIKYLTKINNISKTSKAIVFLCLIIVASATLYAIKYKFFRGGTIDVTPSESLNCLGTKKLASEKEIVTNNKNGFQGQQKEGDISNRFQLNPDGTITNLLTGETLDRFVNNADGTVTDLLTNLMWLQQPNQEPVVYKEAVEFCWYLAHHGYNDWRLPTIEELKGITDQKQQNPALPQNHPFSGIKTYALYWSTSEHKFGPEYVYGMSLWYGKITYIKKTNEGFIWPVRNTQLQN